MSKSIDQHEGKKYLRTVRDSKNWERTVQADVYDVIRAFGVTCPAQAHAIKKLLCAGKRGKGDELADLIGAEAALSRAIDFARQEQMLAIKEQDKKHREDAENIRSMLARSDKQPTLEDYLAKPKE